MGYSQAQKAENKERLLDSASKQIREGGFASINVTTLMKSIGLTHGGFYGHFSSREDLLQQALQRALLDGESTARDTTKGSKRGFADIVRSYLSKKHRKTPSTGCAIATLMNDVARSDDASRQVMERHINAFIDKLSETLGANDAQAKLAASAMIGAIAISRVMTDDKAAETLLADVRDALLDIPHDEL
jgi:TetR/AcrR family transcriptional repressor of nem operon